MKLFQSLLIASIFTVPLTANATIFSYQDNNASNGGALGNHLNTINSTFNSVTDDFSWNATYDSGAGIDGFWLVVNNGPNPKSSDVNELAIIYGDLANDKWTSYVYNGLNSSNSWQSTDYLDSGSLSSSAGAFSLSLDATYINDWAINNPSTPSDPSNEDYTGIAYDDSIGVWFHLSSGSNFSYDNDNQITNYSFNRQGWYDNSYKTTTRVPEPSILLLLSIGLIGLGLGQRKKS